eukprot:TRINITY_DN1693_c0_g1_i2.p1 TRINITY_DN1693_c0_g1~~TRINITY_DN1693_c0_g1_i2.p1  ORF type:complete len:145 (-),score=38.80 TRINITY_DN1693_c0_g1_i2:205-639(-)
MNSMSEKQQKDIKNQYNVQLTPQQLMQLQNQLNIAKAQEKNKIHEIDKLKKDVNKLQEEKNKMEVNQEELLNDLQDLRVLLTRVHQENNILISKEKEKNTVLNKQLQGIDQAVKVQIDNDQHFSNMSNFWEEVSENQQPESQKK